MTDGAGLRMTRCDLCGYTDVLRPGVDCSICEDGTMEGQSTEG
jgi:hypothetical protein